MDKNFKNNFLKGSAAATIGTVTSMVFHFLSIIIITRVLDKTEFGIYAIIIVVVHMFNVISGLGLELTLVKQIAGGTDTEKKEILFPILVLRTAQLLLISALFYLFGNLILRQFGDGLENYALPILILFVLTNYRDLFFYLLQGLNYFRNFAYVQVLSAVSRVLLIGAVVYFGTLDLLALLYIELITTSFAILLQMFYIPFKRLFFAHFNKEVYRSILRFSFPLYLNNLFVFSSGRIHLLIIAAYLTPVSVALYDVANKVPDALKRISQSFIIVFFPSMSSLFAKGDKANGEKLMIRSQSSFSLVLVFITLVSFIFSQELVTLLFSERYIDSAAAFAFLIFSFYLMMISNIMGYSLVSLGYSTVPVKTNLVATIVSIGGSILLIPIIGFMGVVYAQVGQHLVSQLFYRYYLKKAGINRGTTEYLKPLAAGVLIYIVYLIQPLHTFPMKLLFVLLYPVVAWFWLEEFRKLLLFFSNNLKFRHLFATGKGAK